MDETMSGSILSSNNLLNATEQAAKTSGAAASASASSGTAASTASATASSALASIAGNFNSFLTMLTTQLQNQDPSSPMDSGQFTSEIAQFAGVQQQVNTNTNLGQLISLTQNGQVTADSGLVGQKATFTGSQIPLQSGTGRIAFTTASAEPIAIAVTDASGNVVRTVQETSTAGSNSWTWDGKDDSGNSLADGTYDIAVETQDSAGNATAVPFTITGSITGVSKSSSGDVLLQMGSDSVDMNTVTSVGNAA
jgi:flagellar basal-body rod modification protein FlgD